MEACSGSAVVQMTFSDQFFAMVAHDLRNPLGAAHAIANLILRKPSSEDVPRLASRLADNTQRADRMARDALRRARWRTS
jgi:signal transduction histidine kinase